MKKYKLEELKLGMEVSPEQLSEIYDMWIFLRKEYVGAPTGIVVFIGKEKNEVSREIASSGDVISPIFNDSIYLDGDVYFDE